MKRLVVLGAGGYGRTVKDVASQTGKYQEILFLDDNSDYAVGKCNDYLEYADEDTEFYPAFGNNEFRLNWINKFEENNLKVAIIVHPTAYVSPTAKIYKGVVVLPKAVVNTDCVVKKGCIINCGSIVDHGCVIEEGCHICLGAIVKGENHLPKCMKVEAGEVIQLREYAFLKDQESRLTSFYDEVFYDDAGENHSV